MHTSIVNISSEMKLKHKRINNLTPRSFLELLSIFKKIYGEKGNEAK